MSTNLSIAIIGAGASGTITAIQLMQKLQVPATIYLIEKNQGTLFRGAAYSSVLPYQPLNVQTGRMSIYNQAPDDFYEWLKKHKQAESDTEITIDSFVSRRWFGDYLVANFEKEKARSKWVTVEIVISACNNLNYDFTTSNYNLELSNGNSLSAQFVVFACGNEQPGSVIEPKAAANLEDGYIENPWLPDTLRQIQPEEDVLVIGNGLTMVDHVVSLMKQQHRGKIYTISRNGYLPLQHDDIQLYTFEVSNEPTQTEEVLSLLKQNIDKASMLKVSWQNVMDAMRPYTSRFWKGLNLTQKKLFLKKLRTYWEIHRHRMPKASAKALEQLKQSGQLEVLAGSYVSVSKNGSTINFTYQNKSNKLNQSVTVHRILNCTGPSTDYYKTGNILFKNLLAKEWMKQDALKLGIETGFRGEVIKSTGVILQNTFTIGPIRRAMEWETTAIREIRTQAENVAITVAFPSERSYDMATETGL